MVMPCSQQCVSLSDQPHEFQKDELQGEASSAELCTVG